MLSEGTYTYKIVACNINDSTKCDTETGNVVVTYEVSTTAPNVTNDYASPSPFDPHTQTTNVHYTLDKTADVTVSVLDGNTTVRTLTNNVRHTTSGNYGRNTSGTMLSEGTYTYKIVACNISDSTSCDTETGNVTVDYDNNTTTAPVITNDYATPTPFDPHKTSTSINYTVFITMEWTRYKWLYSK